MNMGALILLVVVLLIAVNYLGKKYSNTWDLTEEKLHSLSDQSLDLIKKLDSDLNFVGLYRGASDQGAKQQVKQALDVFMENSSKVKLRFINSYVENIEAEKYLANIKDKDKLILFVEHNKKLVRVEEPFSEQNLTSAIIKATRQDQKTIYFLVGHGERDINSDSPEGLSFLKQRLEGASYNVKELNLLAAQAIPTDTDVLVIAGPTLQILDGERDIIKNYLVSGGRLLIAADPGETHQIALLTKIFGVEYKNNYIFDVGIMKVLGRGIASVLGVDFDETSEITKKFINRRGFTVFDRVSEVTAAPGHLDGIKVTELIRSPDSSFIVNEMRNVTSKDIKNQRPHSFAVVAEGRLKSGNDSNESLEGPEFSVVVFGDSDFMSQKDVINGFNLDLALNSISYLARESDLINIQPKQPKESILILTGPQFNTMVVLGLVLPLVFLVLSGGIWFRRRSA